MTTSFKRASALFFAGLLALAGCSGDAGDAGPRGPAGDPGAPGQITDAKLESCAGCHGTAGASHQSVYDAYTDASRLEITIEDIQTDLVASLSTMTVSIAFDGQPYVDVAGLPGLTHATFGSTRAAGPTFYATSFAAGKFDTTISYGSAKPTGTDGQYTVTAKEQTNGSTGADVKSPLSFRPEVGPAIAFAYAFANPIAFQAFQVYDDLAHDGEEFGAVDYVSAANVSGCEKCHGAPYQKHGYRVAATPDLDDFAACKICHYDTRNGGHAAWQLLVDDPAAYAAQDGEPTAEQAETYAYKATVMNDTHMSHAMEFAYPQSMANCVTCHEGKLVPLLVEANFKLATCKSCHPVTGPVGGTDPKRAPSLTALMKTGTAATYHTMDLYTYAGNCATCHDDVDDGAGDAPMFKDIHTGYNKLIFADTAGTRFSDAFTFAIGTATIDAENVLTFTATVTESILLDGMSVQDVTPTAYVAPYGYDTKDFIQSAKNTNLENPGTGWTVTVTSTATTKTWTVRLDLDTVGGAGWTSRIADGTIQRVELGIRANLANLDGIQYYDDHADPPGLYTSPVALNMVTKTFDIVGKKFLPAVAIVDVNKCNTCHEALATTFHTADRGGSVVGCRLCHTTLRAGGHLEMQSRSIDSYVHAIHAMQPFDTGDLVVTDAVEMLGYEHHVASTYPNFTLMNCESCHFAGTYEVPDRSGSLPGLHSAAAVVAGWDRAVDHVPSYVTGPASRACGSCHRARAINADDAGDLDALNEHVRTFGTMIEGDETVLDAVIKKLMDAFK